MNRRRDMTATIAGRLMKAKTNAASPIAMPPDWSPGQAVADFEIVDELRERVWAHYGRQIQQVLRERGLTAKFVRGL